MSIIGIIAAISKIATIADTAKSIIELTDKVLTDKKSKETNLEAIKIVCQEALKNSGVNIFNTPKKA